MSSASIKTPAKAPARVGKASSSGNYTVKSGDTLSGIAAKHGMSLGAVLSANNLKINSVIYPGQKIKVKGGKVLLVQRGAKTRLKLPPKPARPPPAATTRSSRATRSPASPPATG